MCEELNPDLLVVTEHGFSHSNFQHFQIPNYQLANIYCRNSAKGGGVAVFVRNKFVSTPYDTSLAADKHMEVAGVKIHTDNTPMTVIGVYRSPNGSEDQFFSKFERLLTDVTMKNQNFVVMGDFNIDVLDDESPVTKQFADLLGSFGLVWAVDRPTRVTSTSATAIDNIVTNLTDIRVTVINTAISDHYGQQITINGHEAKQDPINKKTIRDTRPSNTKLLNSLLSKEKWSFLNFDDPVETQFKLFENTFNFHLNVSCPLKKTQKKASFKKCSWITKGILISRGKLLFYSEINRHSTDADFKNFLQNYKRIYRKVIRAAKAYDVTKALLTSKNVSKTTWAIINSKSSRTDKKIELKINNERVSDSSRVADEFNRFFALVGADQGLSPGQPQMIPPLIRSPAASMVLAPVTEEEIAGVIRSFPSKKSNDLNHVSPWLLKQCSVHLLRPLEHLINLSFHSGIFPSSLKTAKVIPIFKKGDPLSTQNYRPISILPVFSKVFEKLFLNRIVLFLEQYNLLSANQFGFRGGRSTIDAVMRLVEMIVEGIESRRDTLSVFLDLSKAFDCVDHSTLTHKLEYYGIRGVPLQWIKSYLSNRKQLVNISDIQSEERLLSHGVPQGSILSPLLFLMYVNDVGSSLHQGRLVQYADDTTLCFQAKSIEELEMVTFNDLNNTVQYFNELNLKTNPSKSVFIKFCLRQSDENSSPTVMLDESEISEVYSAKFLGIYLDRGLTWNSHVDSVCSKLSSGIFLLRQLSKYCPTQVLMTAYYGIIYPHLSYGVTLWGGCSNTNVSRMFILQKKAIRTIAKLQWRESCRPAFKNLKVLTLPCLYILETSVFFKSKCDHVRGTDVHSYDTRGRVNYRTGRHRTVVYERLPSQAGVHFVNKLPNSIKNATTLKAFKARLKCALISQAFYSSDEFMAHNWGT